MNVENIIGVSPGIERVRQLVRKAGPQSTSVLIVGETGTGKELVARALHKFSSATGPFVKIDCSSLVNTLMLSEMFGHTKGAFTGALSARKGLIDAAHNGTIFFDEIGELPLDQQPHLLTALQDRGVRPLGSNNWHPFTSRILAATNVDLRKAVREHRFREDLFYRIKVLTIHVPPLRERIDDIPVLIEHFLNRYAPGRIVSDEVMKKLLTYSWPGNIRELENCIQSSCAVANGSFVGLDSLPSQFQGGAAPAQLTYSAGSQEEKQSLKPSTSLDVLIDAEILRTIQETGNMVEAAAKLGIGRTTLYRKLSRLGYTKNRSRATASGAP